MLKLENISFSYPLNKKKILENISFSISPGEFVGIIGESGIGKSTLLQVCIGLLRPNEGRSTYFGIDCNEARLLLPFGMMLQEPMLLKHLNVVENVVMGGECGVFSLNKKEAWLKAIEMLNIVEIDKYLWTRYPNELSGGQAQRIALAQSLNGQQKIILGLDEPFGAVDAITREILYNRLETIIHSLNPIPTTLLITHSISEAVFLCDKIIILSGKPAQVSEILNIDIDRPRKSCNRKHLFMLEQKIKNKLKLTNTI